MVPAGLDSTPVSQRLATCPRAMTASVRTFLPSSGACGSSASTLSACPSPSSILRCARAQKPVVLLTCCLPEVTPWLENRRHMVCRPGIQQTCNAQLESNIMSMVHRTILWTTPAIAQLQAIMPFVKAWCFLVQPSQCCVPPGISHASPATSMSHLADGSSALAPSCCEIPYQGDIPTRDGSFNKRVPVCPRCLQGFPS